MPTLDLPPYQPHPDYADIPAVQPCVERWAMILPLMPAKAGRMVDVGCHTGWFCRAFAAQGWKAVGIDRSQNYIDIARELAGGAEYICGDVLKMDLIEADVALCLSVAMYLFDRPEVGWRFFDRLSWTTRMMFIDFGGRYADRLPFNEETVVREITSRTSYGRGRLIGRTAFENRPLFLFE